MKKISILLIFFTLILTSCESEKEIPGLNDENWTAGDEWIDTRDWQSYATVQIGDQVWMARNLNYNSKDGFSEANPYFPGYQDIYGLLYDWNTAHTACPEGWHLPDIEEWHILCDYLGGADVAGGKLRQAGTEYWGSSSVGVTNESGFSALPGGHKDWEIGFLGVGHWAAFWVADTSFIYYIGHIHQDIEFAYVFTQGGTEVSFDKEGITGACSVRCIKDE